MVTGVLFLVPVRLASPLLIKARIPLTPVRYRRGRRPSHDQQPKPRRIILPRPDHRISNGASRNWYHRELFSSLTCSRAHARWGCSVRGCSSTRLGGRRVLRCSPSKLARRTSICPCFCLTRAAAAPRAEVEKGDEWRTETVGAISPFRMVTGGTVAGKTARSRRGSSEARPMAPVTCIILLRYPSRPMHASRRTVYLRCPNAGSSLGLPR